MRVVQRHGLPPWLAVIRGGDAAGQAQGGPADASAGLQRAESESGVWAYNPDYSEWQLCHVIKSGDTLWGLTKRYYGPSGQNTANVHRIGDLPRNAPILGSDYKQAIPGDVILIPGLAQPGTPPGTPEPAQPVEPTDPTIPIDFGPPPGWPDDQQWPPIPGDTPPAQPAEPPSLPPPTPGEEPPGAEPIQTGAETAIEKPAKGWWTGPKIALVAGLGVTTIALIGWGIYHASKKPKRRRSTGKRRRRR